MPDYTWDFRAVLEYRDVLLSGILTTLRVLALSVTLGVALGLLLAPLRAARSRWLRWPSQSVIEVVRAVPPLVLVVWAYYCLPILSGMKLSAYWTCVLALGLYGSVFFAEIFRAGQKRDVWFDPVEHLI
ncbi:MAG: ABC transporter permease subunit [Comamonas sp.]